MHDGSKLFLKKLEEDYDPTDKIGALQAPARDARAAASSRPGMIYIEPDRDDFLDAAERRRRAAGEPAARARAPGPEALEEIMEGLGNC